MSDITRENIGAHLFRDFRKHVENTRGEKDTSSIAILLRIQGGFKGAVKLAPID